MLCTGYVGVLYSLDEMRRRRRPARRTDGQQTDSTSPVVSTGAPLREKD